MSLLYWEFIVGKITTFLTEVKEELKKVTWPSKDDTIGTTAVVIVLVIVISVFLGVVDAGLSRLFNLLIG
ncbi:MAG: preprotein translocase subunit SecE [Flexistipes sinusarabici]|uniref:Protein translocase subunit SecE n=1 Tax=Flexistipes sinusarabici TaxID=2352 RepID=A0A5D0MLH6_FLESI|nr:MAG: preprotein translocase subunit SecE [Flexistipes sinusarabici]